MNWFYFIKKYYMLITLLQKLLQFILMHKVSIKYERTLKNVNFISICDRKSVKCIKKLNVPCFK